MENQKQNAGFTLIEVIVSMAILAILIVSLNDLVLQGLKITQNNQLKMAAIILADQKLERIRNLPYTSVGTTGGIVNGVVPDDETVVNGNGTFYINTLVLYVDDPFDGVENGPSLSPPQADDGLPTDYKSVKIAVRWSGPFGQREIDNFTYISPVAIETSVGGGTLVIRVFDASGLPVDQANVQVINNLLSPTVNTNNSLKTNSIGQVILYGAKPSVEGYEVIVTKPGFSTSSSSPRTAQNPNPTIPNGTVTIDNRTEMGFSIDLLSTLSIKAVSQALPGNFKINTDASGENQTNPRMTIDAAGNLYIVWQDYRSASASRIYAQKYSSTGTQLWPSDINISNSNNQVLPETLVDSSGNLYVSWNDNSNGNEDVYLVKRATADGGDLWAGARKVDTAADNKDQTSSKMALATDNNNINVVWQDNRNADTDIFLQRYDVSHNKLFVPEIRVNTDPANNGINQLAPVIAVDSSDYIYVAWADGRNGNQDIYAQKYSPTGIKQWTNDVLVNSDAGVANQYAPSLAISSSSVFITWTDERNGNKDVYAEKLNLSGDKQWPGDVLVNSDGGITSQYSPSIAATSTSLYLVWTDERNGNQDVYAQQLDLTGAKQWDTDLRLNINLGVSSQNNPVVSINPATGEPFAAWQDDRNGNFDIYATDFNFSSSTVSLANVPITVIGAKKIGNGPPIIYKFSNDYLTDSNGLINLPNIEWDSYLVGLQAGYVTHSLIMDSPPSPISLDPNTSKQIILNLN